MLAADIGFQPVFSCSTIDEIEYIIRPRTVIDVDAFPIDFLAGTE